MTSRDFCYWLQGFFELREYDAMKGSGLNQDHVDMIKKHLSLVFKHEIDPSFPNQDELNAIHNPTGTGAVYRC